MHVDHYSNLDLPPESWRRSKDLIGGGCVIDTGAHQLDLLNWYLGPPVEVFACQVGDRRRLEGEIACMAIFKYQSGAMAEFFCNWGAYQSPTARIRGNEGLSVFGREGILYVMDEQTLSLA